MDKTKLYKILAAIILLCIGGVYFLQEGYICYILDFEEEKKVTAWGGEFTVPEQPTVSEAQKIFRQIMDQASKEYVKEREIKVTDTDMVEYKKNYLEYLRNKKNYSNDKINKQIEFIKKHPKQLRAAALMQKTHTKMFEEYGVNYDAAIKIFMREEEKEGDLSIPDSLKKYFRKR